MSDYPGDQRFADEETARRQRTRPLLEDRIKAWCEDDREGYDSVIPLICEAEEELRRLRALIGASA